MKRYALLATALLGYANVAHAQTVNSGTIDGLKYQTLTSPDGCSAANPCQIITYLHYLGGESETPSDIQKYFNTPTFWAANPHTIVVAPMVNGSSSTNNWGGVQSGVSSNMQAAVDLVKQIETTVPTNPNSVVLTGGSMGGIGTEAGMEEFGPKGTTGQHVFASGLSYDGATYNIDTATAKAALCGVPFTMVHGTADTTVPYRYDQALAGALSGCAGFKFVPVSGATHGTWNNGPWGGYAAGTLINQTLATGQHAAPSSATATASSAHPVTAATTPIPIAAAAPTAAAVPAKSATGAISLNLSSISQTGTANSWMLGFPYGGGSQHTLASNGEAQTYSMDGISHAGGDLVLTAEPNTNRSGAWPDNLPFTSGAISSASLKDGMPQPGGFSFTYGTFSMTAELPNYAPGMWPAFWAMPLTGNCEIDVMEAIGTDPGNTYHASLHSDPGFTQTVTGGADLSSGFHTYSVDWEPDTITWLLDGKQVARVATPAACHSAHYLLANVAIGGESWSWPGAASASTHGSMTISGITYTPGPNGKSDGELAGAPTAALAATQSPATAAATPAATNIPGSPAPSSPAVVSGQITPGNGTLTDCQGNVWAITESGSITENGSYTPGGGGTSALSVQGCEIFGQDNGHDGNTVNPGGWFTLSADGQAWGKSDPPSSVAPTTTSAFSAAPADIPTPTDASSQCPANEAGSGAFRVAGGRVISPAGKDWLARGLNVYDNEMDDAAAIIAMFPGINFIRVNIHSYNDPSSYAGFVQKMSARGTVVVFENHPDGGGGQDSSPPGGVVVESAWYAAMGKYYATNPYVWFGTFNEPMATDGLSAWQEATYNAVRGAGNHNPVLMEISGWPGNWTNALKPSVYAQMTNVIWDPHYYGWASRYSTDQATVDKALADLVAQVQQIKSADGTMPVIIGEYGDSTNGTTVDPNGEQAVTAVVSAGANDQFGSAAWAWNPGGNADHVMNGNLTAPSSPYGQMVQLYINSDVVPPSKCQLDAAAQQGIAAATASLQAVSQ